MLQIHQKIEQARLSAGLTQDEIAERLGISRSTYQYWEKKDPSIDKVKQVARVLGVSEDYFLKGGDEILVNDEPNSKLLEENKHLERAIENLSEADVINARASEINARNMERLIDMLAEKMGRFPEPGTPLTETLKRKKQDVK